MPSSPLPPAARGPRRLHPPHPSRPLTGRAGGASAPHPLPGRRGTGRGRGVRGFCSFPSGPQPRAAAAPAPPLPHTPSRPCLPAGDLGRRRRRTDRAGRQLSVRSPAGREGVRGGAERKGGGHSAPPAGESCVEKQRKRYRRHSRRACVVARDGPAPFGPALLRQNLDLDPLQARRPSVLRGLMMSSICGLL